MKEGLFILGKKIICNFDLFGVSNIQIRQNDDDSSDTGCLYQLTTSADTIGQFIAKAVKTTKIPNIHLFGNEMYIQGIIENILFNCKELYGENDIKIEVN